MVELTISPGDAILIRLTESAASVKVNYYTEFIEVVVDKGNGEEVITTSTPLPAGEPVTIDEAMAALRNSPVGEAIREVIRQERETLTHHGKTFNKYEEYGE